MKAPKNFWSDDERTRMIHMREVEKRKWSEIDRALGRPHGSSSSKYEGLRREKSPPAHQKDAGGRIEISAAQEAERAARKAAAQLRDLTAARFGDPPPGFSALDRKREGAAQ